MRDITMEVVLGIPAYEHDKEGCLSVETALEDLNTTYKDLSMLISSIYEGHENVKKDHTARVVKDAIEKGEHLDVLVYDIASDTRHRIEGDLDANVLESSAGYMYEIENSDSGSSKILKYFLMPIDQGGCL